MEISSPNSSNKIIFKLSKEGQPSYLVNHNNEEVIETSYMGFEFKDLPEHYMKNGQVHPAFQFITDVGVDWQQTKVFEAEVGDYVTIARQERGTGTWFIEGITDENTRTSSLIFDFLEDRKIYNATIYKNASSAHWNDNPQAYEIENIELSSNSKLDIDLASEGGFTISMVEKK